MNMKGVKVFSLAVVLAVGAAFGYQSGDPRTFYVAASGGSDDNDGLSREKPFATFAKGVGSLCRHGDTLVLLKGHHYLDGVVPKYTLDTFHPSDTTIVGESSDRSETVVDGRGKYRALYWQSSSSGQRIANLTFQNLGNGQDFANDSEGGTPFRTCDNQLVLSNCVFKNICVTNQYKTTNAAWTPLFIGGGGGTIVDCDFIAITNASPAGSCSGCYMSEAAPHTFVRCKFEDCQVNEGGVVSLRFAESQRGYFTDCLFRNNRSPKTATCVYVTSLDRTQLGLPSSFTRCDFVGNVSGNGTPTVYTVGLRSDTGFYDCGFSNNVAVADGGNVGDRGCVEVSSTNGFHRCTFSNNWTYSSGAFATAGISFTRTEYYDALEKLTRSTNVVSHCVFRNNHTMGTGGTALSLGVGGVRVEDCVFEDNVAHRRAEGGGGAAVIRSGVTGAKIFCRFDRCVFRRNLCLSRGGALNLHDNSLGVLEPCWVRNCLFEGNASTNGSYNAGGAIACIYFRDLAIENCTFITNYCYGTCSDVYARDYGQRVDDEAKWCVSNCLFYGAASQGICLGTWTSDSDNYMRSRAAAKCGRNYLQTVVNATLFPRGERGDVFSDDDPFTDLGNGDLTVTKTSGARDTAAIRPWMTARARDVYGKKRVSGRERETALPDIGAAEFQYRLGLLLILK